MIRNARIDDVPAIRDLINYHAELGLMLFRSPANLYDSIRDFKVCEEHGEIVGCCAMAIMWADLAEIRSLSVDPDYQGKGIGSALVEASLEEARQLRIPKVFALTLEEGFFVQFGFERVPKESLPMKVWSDCIACPRQDHCDEIAMVRSV